MEDTIKKINELIQKIQIEKHSTIDFHISAPPEAKIILKQYYKSSSIEPCTTITITYDPLKIIYINSTIYLHGTYTKLKRNMSQTPHLNYECVSDFTSSVQIFYDADEVVFIGNGREDVDVVCYGRQYVLDVINPKKNILTTINLNGLKMVNKDFRTQFVNRRSWKIYRALVVSKKWDESFLAELSEIMCEEASDIYIKDLNSKDEVKFNVVDEEKDEDIENKKDVGSNGNYKDDYNTKNLSNYKNVKINNISETDKNETSAENNDTNTSNKQKLAPGTNILKQEYLEQIFKCITSTKKIKISLNQKTPLRVLHRRPNLIRERNIELIRIRKFEGTFEFIIRAEAGTYIKEFIHGDFGRTTPSLSEKNGAFCDCVELDVIKIEE